LRLLVLTQLEVSGFKSLHSVTVRLPRLTVLLGPNASGKSNLLDAIQALSRLGTSRTVSEALTEPIRGHAVEAFTFGPGGLPEILGRSCASFSIGARLEVAQESYKYRVRVEIQPGTGTLAVSDEYLCALNKKGEEKGNPSVERVGDQLRIRRKSKPAHPRHEPIGLNHTILSDPRLGGVEYRAIERCRSELAGWRTYYLDPRVSMRAARPPADVRDIGVLGEDIAPFLYRLQAESPKAYASIGRTLRALIPSVEGLSVDLDRRRGTLDIMIKQAGVDYSSRIASEGTLRVLALCAIAANPWSGGLIAFEEPENGVHSRRIELIAKLLFSLATTQGKQVVVTTHSGKFCDAVLRESGWNHEAVALLAVRRDGDETVVDEVSDMGPLLNPQVIDDALTSPTEDGVVSQLVSRGFLE
jgi:predicted ATPase